MDHIPFKNLQQPKLQYFTFLKPQKLIYPLQQYLHQSHYSIEINIPNLSNRNKKLFIIMNFLEHKSRDGCRTSQGLRGECIQTSSSSSKPGTRYSKKRAEIYKTETILQKAARINEQKKTLFETCNEIQKVFPKQRMSAKQNRIDFSDIKSQGIRISIMELQYILVKKHAFVPDVKDTLIKLAEKICKELEKLRDTIQVFEQMKQQNCRLKQSLIKAKQRQSNANSYYHSRKNLKSAAKHDSKVILQNNKLEHMNKQLVKLIEKSQNQKNKIRPKFSENNSISDWRVEQVKNKITYLQLKLSTSQKTNTQLIRRIQTREATFKQNQKKLVKLQSQNIKLKEAKSEWMERSLMQLQDHRYHNSAKPTIRQIAQNFECKKAKIVQREQPRRNSVVQKKYIGERRLLFGYEVDFFKSIRTHYVQNKTACYNRNIRWRADQLGLNYQKTPLDNHQDQEIFPLSQLSFYRPSFYSFVEHLEQTSNDSYQLSRSLIQKMRCIMQSKLNQFLIFQNPSQFTHFPEFVFAWFKKYYFDTDRNCVVESMCNQQSGYEAFKFYRDLMNVKLDQTWQVVTFRQFLLEQLSLQDLFFYLQCQHMLYRKGGITQQIQYIGQFIILVKYSVVKSVLDVVLSEFQGWNIQFLVNKMNQKVIVIKNCQFIESAYFLRCLLEYYKIQRMNRYKYIRKVARQLKQNEKFPILNYIDCMKILSKFPDITESNRLSIYRDCYSVGRGVITPEAIFVVCTQNRIFMKHLKIRSFYKLPIQSTKSFETGTLFCIQPPHPYLYKIFIKLKKLLSEGSSFIRKVMSLGVEDLSCKIQFYRKYFLQWKSFNDNSILKCKHFLHFVKECLSLVSAVNYYYIHEFLNNEGKLSNKININMDQNQIGEMYSQDAQVTVQMMQNTIALLDWKIKVQKFRQNSSAVKIQRMVRKKFIQPYVQIYNVMFDKVKKIKYFGNPN